MAPALALPSGSWILTITMPEYADFATVPISVTPGATTTAPTVLLESGDVPTVLRYTGDTVALYRQPLTLAALLTEDVTDAPVAGVDVVFTLDGETYTATTDADGLASVTITPELLPGTYTVDVGFAGAPGFEPSSATASLRIDPGMAQVWYTGKTPLALGYPGTLTALLRDANGDAPIAGAVMTYVVAGETVTAMTDEHGIAIAAVTIPATAVTGNTPLSVTFAGNDGYEPATDTVNVLLFQRHSFVVWGGNDNGPRHG